ncbi:Min6p NDAI_0J00620 [Naumovozyma dairenensis CBS 421]|uniref:Uncharacterized protein n=1 Tax=Naumovozyma dairenensis (strain ATCC 10597 / BCRC 20456 / CBS 421 / NBRC 0211 / NRRL Y-12639) TaxID=1071378 RepID=G0WGM6_NAUDC|nr:hypothetical protein NDAI_0J00620 [Naumovozyma dairenensis CBS 421]CCD26954.1 hypothetical protein NDAI_0J00620 [Naumovozyma dairenensis CBS 421]
MSLFGNRSLFSFIQRVSRNPTTAAMWLFSGFVVSSASYMLFYLPSITPNIGEDQDEELQELIEIE